MEWKVVKTTHKLPRKYAHKKTNKINKQKELMQEVFTELEELPESAAIKKLLNYLKERKAA